MQSQVIWGAVLLLSTAGAEPGLPDRIESVNQAVKSVGKQDCETCAVTVAGRASNAKDDIEKCVEALCPNADVSILKIYDLAYKKAAATDQLFDSEVAPLVKKIATAEALDQIATSKETLEWLKTAPPLKDVNAIRIFNLFSIFEQFSKFKFKAEGERVVIDEKESRKEFSSDSAAEFKRKIKTADVLLQAFLVKRISESDPGTLRMLYPGGQLAKLTEEFFNEFRERLKKVMASKEFQLIANVSFMDKVVNEATLKRIFSSGEFNPEAIQELNRTHSLISVFEATIKDEEFKKALTSPPLDIKAYARKQKISNKLSKQIERSEKFLKSGHPDLFTKCKTTFALAQELLPTPQEIENFRKNESAIKAKFKAGIARLVSSESNKLLGPNIERWSFNYPSTKQAHLNNMKQTLRSTLDEASKWPEENREINESKYKNQFYAIRLATIDKSEEKEMSGADDPCEDLMPAIVPDSSYSPNGGFVVGPLVLRNAESEGLMYHEMGHLLKAAFKSIKLSSPTENWFKKSLACLATNHADASNFEKYESEDWADLISSQFGPSSNSLCLIALRTDDADYKSFSLKNEDETDPHSSHFFRLLHIDYLKQGKNNPHCLEALNQIGEIPRFKNCLK